MRGLLAPLVKLVAFLMVTAMATYVLAATITNAGYGKAVSYYGAVLRRHRPAGRRRRPGVGGAGRLHPVDQAGPRVQPRRSGVGPVPGPGQVRRLGGPAADQLGTGQAALPQPGRPALPGTRAGQRDPRGARDDAEAEGGHPAQPDPERPGPVHPVRRVQAAVQRAGPGRDQRPVDADHPDPAGRGRHRRQPAAPDRRADLGGGRQGQGDRRPGRQPVLGAGHPRPARPEAVRADRAAAALGVGPGRRPQDDRRLDHRHQRPDLDHRRPAGQGPPAAEAGRRGPDRAARRPSTPAAAPSTASCSGSRTRSPP